VVKRSLEFNVATSIKKLVAEVRSIVPVGQFTPEVDRLMQECSKYVLYINSSDLDTQVQNFGSGAIKVSETTGRNY
jgi:hypothetical protein